MTHEMIERVAEAIYNHWANYPVCEASKSWLTICEKLPAQADDFRRKAKAAIEAMLEPTDDMVKFAEAGISLEEGSSAYGCWKDMINQVLK